MRRASLATVALLLFACGASGATPSSAPPGAALERAAGDEARASGVAPPAVRARFEASGEATPPCTRAYKCCRAYLTTMAEGSDVAIDPEEVCAGVRELRTSPVAEEVCGRATEGWRQALETAGHRAPDVCAPRVELEPQSSSPTRSSAGSGREK